MLENDFVKQGSGFVKCRLKSLLIWVTRFIFAVKMAKNSFVINLISIII